jgi:hypothetical protein
MMPNQKQNCKSVSTSLDRPLFRLPQQAAGAQGSATSVKQITLAAEENPTKVAKCLTLSAERRLTLSNEMNPKASHASRNPQLL